jgi:hypothetical protein
MGIRHTSQDRIIAEQQSALEFDDRIPRFIQLLKYLPEVEARNRIRR